MKVLFDTNVVLDALLKREPYWIAAAELFAQVESETLMGYLCATTHTTLYYISAKTIGRQKANAEVARLLQLFEVTPVNRLVLETALNLDLSDFEDAVLAASAHHMGIDALVTRNVKDFKKAGLPVHTPEQLLHILKA